MKLHEYIKKLQEINEKYPDSEVIYASDDEGNYYKKLNYPPVSCVYVDGDEVLFEEEFDDIEEFLPNAVCIN